MNSPRFIRFTPAFQPGDVFVRADAVTYVDKFHPSNAGLMGIPKEANDATVIGTGGYANVYVKESPSQVIEALRAADDTHLVTVEYLIEDGDTPSLVDDCDYALALKEAQADAKIADERAEWYRKRSEMGDALLRQGLVEVDKVKSERDQLLAKLKDTTAALEKANAELNAAKLKALLGQHGGYTGTYGWKLGWPKTE